MKKVYFLSTCSTCKDIMKLWDLSEVEKINLKKQPLTELDLNELYSISKSYELLFNKRALLSWYPSVFCAFELTNIFPW